MTGGSHGRGTNSSRPRRVRAAVLLAAGSDPESRELLTRPLGDSTVVQLAVENVRTVVDPARIVVVVSRDDTAIRGLLGSEVTYVVQDAPRGTGDAALLGLGYLLSDTEQVLVTYADTPLLRPESLLGLFTRHRLKGADLSILTAVVDDPDPTYGRVVREDGRIAAIVEGPDQTSEHDEIREVNVGGYVATPSLFLGTLATMAAAGEHRLTDLARRVISSGGRVHSYQIHDPDEVQGINTPRELAAAEDIVLKRLFVPREEHRHEDRVRHGRLARGHRGGLHAGERPAALPGDRQRDHPPGAGLPTAS